MRTRFRSFRPLLLLPVLAVLLAVAGLGAPTVGIQDPEARRAAQAWIALVDAGQYQQSWTEAGRLFQRTTTADAWARDAATIRQRTGSSLRRELITDTDVTDPPGVPAGEYFRIRYETECASGIIRETVLLVQEAGRGWRVVRYDVEPTRG
jgi:hypothetical protein